MRILLLLALLGTTVVAAAQSLPIDFEGGVTTTDFVDFNGGTAEVIANPYMDADNPSATVARIIRNGGDLWAGSKIVLDAPLTFTNDAILSLKLYTAAPIGTIVRMKLEDASGAAVERDLVTTKKDEWETLTWDFAGTPPQYDQVVFMFDFGIIGDSGTTSTFYFDDVEQVFTGFQIDLPVDFEEDDVNYTMTDFEGTISTQVADPDNSTNQVMEVYKPAAAAPWSGTVIGTREGFANVIPITLAQSTMTARVWAPAAGMPVRLKIEDAADGGRTCETETLTDSAGWQVMTFDFTNEVPNTNTLQAALDGGWEFNLAAIFFNFGVEDAGDQIFYFDNVAFGEYVSSVQSIEASAFTVYSNPTTTQWVVELEGEAITSVALIDAAGRQVAFYRPNAHRATIGAQHLPSGIYLARITTSRGVGTVRLVKG